MEPQTLPSLVHHNAIAALVMSYKEMLEDCMRQLTLARQRIADLSAENAKLRTQIVTAEDKK